MGRWDDGTSQICIAHELKTRDRARYFAECFQGREETIVFLGKTRFPTGDAMFAFLSHLSSKYDAAFIVISASNESLFWISKELKMQRNMGNFTNVYPAFLSALNIPNWWTEEDGNFLAIDSACRQKIDILLKSQSS